MHSVPPFFQLLDSNIFSCFDRSCLFHFKFQLEADVFELWREKHSCAELDGGVCRGEYKWIVNYNLGEKPFAGYEPNALKKTDLQKDLFGMFARRRATEAELQQGEDEMRRAQRRLDSELASGTEPQLERI